jgi:hypothetical protein
MTPAEYRRKLIQSFGDGTETVNIPFSEYQRCFPDEQSLAEFIRTTGLHIHKNETGFEDPGRITISIHVENPWGDPN